PSSNSFHYSQTPPLQIAGSPNECDYVSPYNLNDPHIRVPCGSQTSVVASPSYGTIPPCQRIRTRDIIVNNLPQPNSPIYPTPPISLLLGFSVSAGIRRC